MRQRRVAGVEHRAEVDCDRAIPLIRVELDRIAVAAHAGVIEQYVDAAELGDGAGNHALDLGPNAYIPRGEDRAIAAELADQRLAAGSIAVGDDQPGAFAVEQADGRLADARGATGDDRHPTVESRTTHSHLSISRPPRQPARCCRGKRNLRPPRLKPPALGG